MANQIKSSCFIKWLFNTCVSYNSAILSVFGREFQRISAIIHNGWHEAYRSWKSFFKCIHITRLGYISTKFPRPGSDVPSSLKHDMWHSRPRVPILLHFAPFRSISLHSLFSARPIRKTKPHTDKTVGVWPRKPSLPESSPRRPFTVHRSWIE